MHTHRFRRIDQKANIVKCQGCGVELAEQRAAGLDPDRMVSMNFATGKELLLRLWEDQGLLYSHTRGCAIKDSRHSTTLLTFDIQPGETNLQAAHRAIDWELFCPICRAQWENCECAIDLDFAKSIAEIHEDLRTSGE